jgi:hypothetical protein
LLRLLRLLLHLALAWLLLPASLLKLLRVLLLPALAHLLLLVQALAQLGLELLPQQAPRPSPPPFHTSWLAGHQRCLTPEPQCQAQALRLLLLLLLLVLLLLLLPLQAPPRAASLLGAPPLTWHHLQAAQM